MTRALTPKEETFAVGLASGLTQADAFRKAFPHCLRWKDKTIHERASRLAARDKVRARVQELGQKAAAANQVTVERIVAELAKVAFGDARQVMRWTEGSVKLVPSEELTPDQAAMVAEVKGTTSLNGGSISLKTHSKLEALKLLGEHLGMFTKKHELTGKDGKDLVPEAPKGVLVVPGVLDEKSWEQMMAKHQGGDA